MHLSELVFAYGSNMDPAQMRERCPESDLSWFIAEARGWRLCFPRESKKRKGGVGSIVKSEEASVWGVVFTVSERDLARLDSCEGVPGGAYNRAVVDVVDRHGRGLSVWTYFAVRQGPEQEFLPHSNYITLYIKGAEYFGLPASYIGNLKKIRDGSKKI
jgi:gamma-glutamylcyclotransferase (GGCT)/AIG2-like uncharacterized protein YtfP